jgi:nanoRNase/pAp phosphatase (c-di-AMP/oligoRNAs hydrolase)
VYNDIRADLRKWSLRSRPGFDVAAVAKSLGGGGHAQAAGFVEERGSSPEPACRD